MKRLVITVLKSQRYFQTPYAYGSMVVSRLTVFRMHPCVPPRDGSQKGKRREEKRSQWMKGRASAMNVERMVRQIRRFFSGFQAR